MRLWRQRQRVPLVSRRGPAACPFRGSLTSGGQAPSEYQPHVDQDHATPAGTLIQQPKGIILHGSRSGLVGRPLRAEYEATRRYVNTNPYGLSWHATVGEDRYSVHLPADTWGWHARSASRSWLGVEIAQPTADVTVTDAQVRALAHWLQKVVLARWPNLTLTSRELLTHAEAEAAGLTGQADGKTDVYPYGDIRAGELRQRLLARLEC